MPDLIAISDEEDTAKLDIKPETVFKFTEQERQTLNAILDVFRYEGSPRDLLTLLKMPGANIKVLKEVIQELYYQQTHRV